MSKAAYWQRGEALDYVNDGDEVIEAGTVLALGDKIGIAGEDIQPGAAAVGSVHVTGVFWFPKTGTSAMEIGQTVYYDGEGITDSNGSTDSGDTGDTGDEGGESTNVVAGFVAIAAAADDEKVAVKINA